MILTACTLSQIGRLPSPTSSQTGDVISAIPQLQGPPSCHGDVTKNLKTTGSIGAKTNKNRCTGSPILLASFSFSRAFWLTWRSSESESRTTWNTYFLRLLKSIKGRILAWPTATAINPRQTCRQILTSLRSHAPRKGVTSLSSQNQVVKGQGKLVKMMRVIWFISNLLDLTSKKKYSK